MTTSLITRGVGGVLRLSGQADLPVTVLLRHRAEEPRALRAVVVMDDDDSFELLLDRTQLTEGLTGQPSADEVQVRVEGLQVLVVVGDLTLALGLADVIDVLLATYHSAPTGTAPERVIALEARARELSQI